MPLPKLKNLFVSETRLRFCAVDLWISFLALAIASKTVSETYAKWSQFGAVSETQGLAYTAMLELFQKWPKPAQLNILSLGVTIHHDISMVLC